MVKISRSLILLWASICLACGAADVAGSSNDSEHSAAGNAAQTLLFSTIPYRGVNLASAEFGIDSAGNGAIPGVHGKDYVYPDPAYAGGYRSADYFLSKRMNTFRLPFRWERLQPARTQPFAGAELARLKTTVGNLTSKGAVVLLDPHNYARYGTQVIGAGIPNSHFADFWSRLAQEFKGNASVIFGLMNEPFNLPTEQWVNAANAAIAAIRATGATNLILVPGNAWSGAHSWTQNWYGTSNAQALLQIRDPGNNVGFEVHQYLDANFSGTSSSCPSATGPADAMQSFTNWLRSHGKKGFLGEFSGGDGGTCLQALDNLLRHMVQNQDVYLGWTYWAAGPWWGNGLSLEPNGNADKPQMVVLGRYLTGATTPNGPTPPSSPGSSSCSATYEAESMSKTSGGPEDGAWNLWSVGYLATTHAFTGSASTSTITVRARGTSAAGVWPVMSVTVGGQLVGRASVASTSYRDYSFSVTGSGSKEIRVSFDNDLQANGEDRNLIVDSLWVRCAGACSTRTLQAETMAHSTGQPVTDGWNITSFGYVAADHDFSGQPTTIRITARGTFAGGAWPRMTLSVGGTPVGTAAVSSSAWSTYAFRVTPSAGTKQIRVSFDNDYYQEGEDRNLLVDALVVSCP
jgi:endoglucanase